MKKTTMKKLTSRTSSSWALKNGCTTHLLHCSLPVVLTCCPVSGLTTSGLLVPPTPARNCLVSGSITSGLLVPPTPRLTALWDTDHSATVSWHQETRGCLYRNRVFLSCFERPGSYVETFGAAGPLDAAYRPAAGDVYSLWTPEGVYHTQLIGRAVFLPVIRGA